MRLNCWIRKLASLLIGLLTAVAPGLARAQAGRPSPNIVFIMADDMGYGDAGCYGQQHIRTPHIDVLAEDGIRFTQCYAGSPVCAPSRSVLMTGRHTGHTTVRGNFGQGGVRGLAGKAGRVPLNDDDVTVAEILQQAGYTTGMFGKWGLGEPDTSGEPNRQGFDTWFGYLNQRRAHSYYPDFLWHNRTRFILPGNQAGQRRQYSHDLIAERAIQFIRDNQSTPFFLYQPFTTPHARFEVPELERYTDAKWPRRARIYASMISRMDRDIGRLLGVLEELQLADNTILFFCSDNGAADRYEGLFDSSGPLRRRKRDLYEGGIRTPMIVRWPARIPPGVKSDVAWYFADVLPTLADIAGSPPPAEIDGVSVLPSLLREPQDLHDRFLYWEFFERGFQQAARWRNYKCVRLAGREALEIYDLGRDEGEQHNIAADVPEIVDQFESYLKTARTESPAFPTSPNPSLR